MEIAFYILSAMILGFGLFAVTTRKIFRAAIFLLFSLVGIAGLFFLLQNEFVAAVQIVVYVGGIVVLIIFSIFLTQQSSEGMELPSFGRALFSGLAAVVALCFSFLLIQKQEFISTPNSSIEPSVTNIGLQMLSMDKYGFILPFEVVSVLLLAAMIGAIVIALKIKTNE